MTPRNPVLRLKRGSRPTLEVLSDGGKFVVQELPLTGLDLQFDPFGPGTATITMQADRIQVEDPA